MPTPPTMPGRTHHSAPKFDGTPSLLSNFFDEIDQLAETCEITEKQTIAWALRYAPTEENDLWKEVPSANGTSWPAFKEDIYELYPGSTGDRKYTLVNLEALTDAQVKETMDNTAQFGAYYRAFTQISNFLKKKGRLSDREISGRFINGLDASFRAKVRAQLYAENPTHHTDDPYEVAAIRKAALFVLSCNNGDMSPSTPVTVKPTVKREQFDMSALGNNFNYAILAQEMAKIMSKPGANSTNSNSGFTNNYRSNAGPGAPRTNYDCIFCGDASHYLGQCPRVSEYISSGRCSRNNENQIVLPNGDRVNPRMHPGRNLMERIDNWHKTNSPPNTLSSNMFSVAEISHLEAITSDAPVQSQFVWTEIDDEDDRIDPGIVGNEEELLQTLLNNTQKKLDDARKTGSQRTEGPITRSAAARNNPPAAQKARKDTEIPSMAEAAVSQHASNPVIRNANTGMPSYGQGNQFRYVTPIESQEAFDRVMKATMGAKIEVSVHDMLAVSLDLRKNIREQISSKKVPIASNLPNQVNNLQTYMAALPARSDGVVVSNHSEKLRAIDILVNNKHTFEAIMDEGSQIIAIRKDLWESLGLAVRRDHQVSMESANSSVNLSVGLLQDLKCSIGGYDFYLQVQVIENAPYEILLGLPFHVLTELKTKFFNDGSSHITLKDPNSGAIIMVPTKVRKPRETTNSHTNGSVKENALIQGF